MRHWANFVLRDHQEELVDSASSYNSEIMEFKFDGFNKIDNLKEKSPMMSTIENFEKL